ncbi:MAG: dolichol kinase [Acidilobaceae archaeon]
MVSLIIWPYDFWGEALVTVFLSIYVLLIIFSTLIVYLFLVSRGFSDNVARYYNRKIIHMFAGGVVATLTPFIYTSPLFPLIASLLLAILLTTARRFKPMYWFQSRDNFYEVNFVLAWGISVFILWHILYDPFKAVLPAIFISYGDAITGIVRNTLFRRRTKHWIGNIAMGLICIPIGLIYAGITGLIAAVVATIVERFEYGPIDDNILIVAISTLILIAPHLIVLVY